MEASSAREADVMNATLSSQGSEREAAATGSRSSEPPTPKEEAEERRRRRQVWIANTTLTSYVILYLTAGVLLAINVILPQVVLPELSFVAHFVAYYIFVMTTCNFFGVWFFRKESHFSRGTLDHLPTKNPAAVGWWYCSTCDIHSPPRSRHCVMCDKCVLKRDHHCFFASGCVGHYNQRFFVVMCFYSFLGALYTSIITAVYLGPHYAYLISSEFYTYLLPVVLWRLVTLQMSLANFGLIFYLWMSVFTTLGALYFFVWQVVLIARGQTPIEVIKRVHTYRLSLMENVNLVFGSAGPLYFVFPLLFLKAPGDGINWSTSYSAFREKFN